jgi:hypothetical protein
VGSSILIVVLGTLAIFCAIWWWPRRMAVIKVRPPSAERQERAVFETGRVLSNADPHLSTSQFTEQKPRPRRKRSAFKVRCTFETTVSTAAGVAPRRQLAGPVDVSSMLNTEHDDLGWVVAHSVQDAICPASCRPNAGQFAPECLAHTAWVADQRRGQELDYSGRDGL